MPASSLLQRFKESPFLRNVATMMTGTVIAQAIPMALSPVMTRLYEPREYGIYAAFMFVATTLSAFASWRYELAVMLPEKDDEAANIVGLCLGLAMILALLLVAVGVFGGAAAFDVMAGARLGNWVYAVPVMVVLMSVFQTLNYWLIRLQAFQVLSVSRVARALAMAAANIGFGVAHVSGGLILSSTLGQAVITTMLVGYVVSRRDRRLGGFRLAEMRELGRRHRRFALYALPADLLSTFATQSPLLLLDEVSRGLYAFVQLVVNAPLSVVSGSVLDAFKDRAARDYRERGEFADIFDKIAKTLASLGIVPTLVLVAFGPALFRVAFGAEWEEAGTFAQFLGVMYFLKLIVSPLSYSYYIVEKQREDFILHVLVLLFTFAGVWVGIHWFESHRIAVALYATAYSATYVLYFIRSRSFSRGSAHA